MPGTSFALRAALVSVCLAASFGTASAVAPRAAHPAFVANQGQLSGPAKLYAVTPDCAAYFEPHGVVLDRKPDARTGRQGMAIRVSFPSSGGAEAIEALAPRADRMHVFSGSDPAAWHAGIATYDVVRYRGIADGADLVYHMSGNRLEYDVVLAPQADLSGVKLRYRGADRLEVGEDGALRIHTPIGVLHEQAPILYQEKAGVRMPVRGGYRIQGRDQIGFWAGSYDHTATLVVDPGIAWSTYLGGSAADEAYGVASDASGNVYVVGTTASSNYPMTPGAYQSSKAAGSDVVVTKLRADGATVLWSTCLGGVGNDIGRGICLDASGNIYVTGNTGSLDFPTTSSAYSRLFHAGVYDGFVAKLSPNGNSLVYSTFVGASWDDYPRGIAVDGSGAATIAGFTNSLDYPVTASVVKPTRTPSLFDGADGFVTKLNAAGSALVYSTYLGTNGGTDEIMALALDGSGRATVTGWTASSAYPTTTGAFSRTHQGNMECFVTRLNATATGYVFSTFLGGTGYDESYGIAVGSGGDSYVVGRTTSPNFPTTAGAYRPTFSGGNYYDAFVTKISSTGAALGYSTFIGGAGNDLANAVAVSGAGAVAVVGTTDATNFPVTQGATSSVNAGGGTDAFALALTPSGGSLLYSTYIGGGAAEGGQGVVIRPNGHVTAVGFTASTNYPTTSGSADATQNSSGTNDCFVSDFDMGITTGSAGVEDVAHFIALAPPTPNPFRGITRLGFTLAEPGHVTAHVVDVQGRLVATLADEALGVGTHTLAWDGRDASGQDVGAGIFRIVLTTPAGQGARSVVRLR